MNKPLSLVLLAALGDLPYIDKKSGLVQVISKQVKGADDAFNIKKFPVSTLTADKDCNQADTSAVDMIPNSKFRGILYFEDRGTSPTTRRSSSQMYRSDLRLVCWLNTKKITGAGADMTIAAKAMNNFIQSLTGSSFASDPFINIVVQVSRIAEANANIFSEYNYEETVTQYLMSPFDFFAIDLNVSFSLAKNCPIEITPSEDPGHC